MRRVTRGVPVASLAPTFLALAAPTFSGRCGDARPPPANQSPGCEPPLLPSGTRHGNVLLHSAHSAPARPRPPAAPALLLLLLLRPLPAAPAPPLPVAHRRLSSSYLIPPYLSPTLAPPPPPPPFLPLPSSFNQSSSLSPPLPLVQITRGRLLDRRQVSLHRPSIYPALPPQATLRFRYPSSSESTLINRPDRLFSFPLCFFALSSAFLLPPHRALIAPFFLTTNSFKALALPRLCSSVRLLY